MVMSSFAAQQNLPRHSASLFSILPKSKVYYADVTDLPRPVASRVDGTTAVGFVMVSVITPGDTATFTCDETPARGEDGDLEFWVFSPTAETIATHPKLKGWTVKIFND